ncbi:hypothetical protein PAXRUDRAFT_355623 [Paxillus rubicundulus Ve08.2h10]|uniref:Uncharacterized protein n=1 Tax=Paxillus rubicundulus Ve08.2h10 TaxID=930991 RepID=A0A0D0E9H1_9AGAM|nr:hypothetical protein PAXRUDRAFT_355623 [Paxillus rubicundulus Ve08.2h10]
MAGFLRKKATKKPSPSTQQPLCASPSKVSSDAAPFLPPLFTQFTRPSLVDPEPSFTLSSSYGSSPAPPVTSTLAFGLPTPSADHSTSADDWNPWKGYAEAPNLFRLAAQPSTSYMPGSNPTQLQRPAPQPARPMTAPQPGRPLNNWPMSRIPLGSLPAGLAAPQSLKLSASKASSGPVDTYHTTVSRPNPIPRKTFTRQVREEKSLPPVNPPKDEALGNKALAAQPKSVSANVTRASRPPTAVRGPAPHGSSFDFEESLSAANVTSVVNQFRSYPPPTTHRQAPSPPASQDPQKVIQSPQLPNDCEGQRSLPKTSGSSSSLSSSGNHTNGTHGSYGTTSTSATSITSVTKVIDVRTDAKERLASSQPTPSSNDSGCNDSFPHVVAGHPHSPSINHRLPAVSPSSQRNITTNAVTSRAHHCVPPTSAPPTSYPERNRVSLARQTSFSSQSSFDSSEAHTHSPMPFDALRSRSVVTELGGSVRKGPLIFAARSSANENTIVHYAYPSPPAEYASLEPSGSPRPKRSASISSILQDVSRDALLSGPPVIPFEPQPRARKLSKNNCGGTQTTAERTTATNNRGDIASESFKPRVLTKSRPTPPSTPNLLSYKLAFENGDPLLLDDDPFAKVEGVQVVRTKSRSSSRDETQQLPPSESKGHDVQPTTPPLPNSPPTPVSPDDYKAARQQRRGQWLDKAPPPLVAEVIAKQQSMQAEGEQVEGEPIREPTPPPTYFPIVTFMSDVNLLPLLLACLTYSEWLALYSANKQIRELFQSRILREFVLERHLRTVGYSKWEFEWAEPLALSLKDLNNYMRGVSMPTHQYGRLAAEYLQPKGVDREDQSVPSTPDIISLALTTRAYTRVVLRLRAQAESEARHVARLKAVEWSQNTSSSRPGTRDGHRQPSASSRAASPTSSYSHSRNHSHGGHGGSQSPSTSAVARFRSPLVRPGRAPLLRVFVPSPDGDWLSDASVVECEAELKRSGVLKLLKVGDVIWDVAVGDEGNLGRLVWDGSYLVDLDYKYSRMGELSPYFHSLAFSPSYFHRTIRIGSSATHNPHCNPIVHVDVGPWGQEIAENLQLLQDRARTETPHGALHDVVRWVHRSSFTIRRPVPHHHAQAHPHAPGSRVPIPNVNGFFIDPAWYGTVVIEAEGTNEGLVDLQERCGPGVFPPRAETVITKIRNTKEREGKKVWRIMREKSRPGEIWLRAVREKERIM